jgi:acyl-CoA synthetase (AMP-forming)/AMP-acid ligase II
MTNAKSLIDILSWRAINQSHQLAYRFLHEEENVCSYGELDRKARAIAIKIQSISKPGDRVLLLYPPGLDFIFAYFGCLYAQVIAVPAYPPHPARLERTLPMIRGIIADSTPKVALVNRMLRDAIKSKTELIAEFPEMKWCSTELDTNEHWDEAWEPLKYLSKDLAFIQYTSGSTGDPKGVMVSHGNVLHNLSYIEKVFGLSPNSNTVLWLPPYHDMGLIGGILQALYSGYPITLFSHFSFLQKPYRWLEAISRFGASVSGAPNFAYDLCVKKIKPELRDSLDLSGWRIAFNGAEKVHHDTLTRFANYFQSCGFNRKAFVPCYGLAEATLLVTGTPHDSLPKTRNLIASELGQNNA